MTALSCSSMSSFAFQWTDVVPSAIVGLCTPGAVSSSRGNNSCHNRLADSGKGSESGSDALYAVPNVKRDLLLLLLLSLRVKCIELRARMVQIKATRPIIDLHLGLESIVDN